MVTRIQCFRHTAAVLKPCYRVFTLKSTERRTLSQPSMEKCSEANPASTQPPEARVVEAARLQDEKITAIEVLASSKAGIANNEGEGETGAESSCDAAETANSDEEVNPQTVGWSSSLQSMLGAVFGLNLKGEIMDERMPPPPPSEWTVRELSLKVSEHKDRAVEESHVSLATDLPVGVADAILEGRAKNIIVMTGAGISVAAGIPDFRSPGTGLYDNLQKYDLEDPTDVFDVSFFQENPKPFCCLAKELYPGSFNPTNAHYFIRLLHEKGVLLRNFTQNIDTLERIAGIPPEKLVEAHGSFATAHCITCRAEYPQSFVKDRIMADDIPTCFHCKGYVKPDIVFFGEQLPERFHRLREEDFRKCDLLIVMGTSLTVQPFASLIDKVDDHVPRLLINRETVGLAQKIPSPRGGQVSLELLMGLATTGGFRFDEENNYRDVQCLGNMEDKIIEFVEVLGWQDEFDKIKSKGPILLSETVGALNAEEADGPSISDRPLRPTL